MKLTLDKILVMKLIIIVLVMNLVGSNLYWYVATLPTGYSNGSIMTTSTSAGKINGWDMRDQRAISILILNMTWQGYPHLNNAISRPLPNVTGTLFDANMQPVDFQITNNSGIMTFTIKTAGVFYLRIDYWGYWQIGGVEIIHKWIAFNGSPNGTSETVPISQGPMLWPTGLYG